MSSISRTHFYFYIIKTKSDIINIKEKKEIWILDLSQKENGLDYP